MTATERTVRERHTTSIYEIASGVLRVGATGKASHRSKPITEGMVPRKPKIRGEGIYTLEPEELLYALVERVTYTDGAILGYQRELIIPHARDIGRALAAGRKIAPPTFALGAEDNLLYATDGQHRSIGAIIVLTPIRVIVERLTLGERIARFADQALARRPDLGVLILGRADVDPVSAYIRRAIEAEHRHEDHPLAGFVALHRADRRRLGVTTVYDFLAPYALNALGGTSAARAIAGMSQEEGQRRLPDSVLDEAARLLQTFGAKQSAHPLAYAPSTVRALRDVAIAGVRRADDPEKAVDRWLRVMPKFNFNRVPVTATRTKDIRFELAKHWNRNVPAGLQRVAF